MRTWRNLVVLAAVSALGLSACGGDDGDGGGSAAEEFCDLARRADQASDDMGAAFETADPEEIERVFDESMADLEAAADAAPDAISDIADEVTETAQELRDRLEELDWDIAAFIEDERALDLAAQGEGPNNELDQFLEDECDIPADDESEDATASVPDDTASAPEGTGGAPDPSALAAALAEQFETLGLSAEQSECLATSLLDALGAEGLAGLDPGAFDPSSPEGGAFIDALGECDIDPTDIIGG